MKLQIIQNSALCGDIFRMKVSRGKMKEAAPGQFVHIRCSDSYDPLLRRPFSVAGMDDGSFEIIYRVVGKGTFLLSEKKQGALLDVIGPLGRGFPLETLSGPSVIAAGGMGIAPTLFLARKMPGRVEKFILGAKTRELLVCSDELKKKDFDFITATDDGTCGVRGDVCSVLSSVLSDVSVSAVCACGPYEMLHSVHRIAKNNGVRALLCFENMMACGVGACLGCAIRTCEDGKSTYRRVCKDGPVFNGEIIEWEDPA